MRSNSNSRLRRVSAIATPKRSHRVLTALAESLHAPRTLFILAITVTAEEKNDFDALFKIVEHHSNSWMSRRQHEQLAISLAFWAFLAGAIVQWPTGLSHWWYCGCSVLLGVLYGWWIGRQLDSFRTDRNREDMAFRSALEAVLQTKMFLAHHQQLYLQSQKRAKDAAEERSTRQLFYHWSVRPYYLMTALLIAGGTGVIFHRQEEWHRREQDKSLQVQQRLNEFERSVQRRLDDIDRARMETQTVPKSARTKTSMRGQKHGL